MLVKQLPRSELAVEDPSVPVVVLNLFTHCGVGVVRSLGRLGVPVYSVHRDLSAPSLRSRYSRGALTWDIEHESPEASVEYLVNLARTMGGRPILIPTEDVSSLFVDEHAHLLGDAYRFPRRPAGLAQSLSSKEAMYFLCREVGVPTPATFFPKSREDAETFARTATFPVMMKGIDSRKFQDAPGAGKVIATSRDALLSRYDQMTQGLAERAVIFQEYIPGEASAVWMFNGYFDEESECVFGVTGQKLRQYPPYIGQTSLGYCANNPAVHELTRRFMKAVGYTGILDIGFRYDARDGRYKVLDVNPRVGSAFRLFAARNELDVVRVLYLHLTGQPVPVGTAREGRKWVVENYDAVSSAKYFRDGVLRPREWLRSFRGVEEAAWFSWDDPRPFGAMCIQSVRYAVAEWRSDAGKRSWWGAIPPVAKRADAFPPDAVSYQRRIDRHFDASARHWKELYDTRSLEGTIHQRRRSFALQWIDESALPNDARVLEVGCGAGLLALDLADRGYEVDCIDSSRAMVGLAMTEARDADVAGRISIDLGDAHALSFDSCSFDLVVALGVLPFLHAPERAIAEMARVAKPGGCVLFSSDNKFRANRLLDPRYFPFPGREALKQVLTWVGARPPSELPTRLFSYRKLERTVEAVGLGVERCVTLGFGPFTLLGREVFAEPRGIRLNRSLQEHADRGVAIVRSLGAQHLVLARKA